MLARVVTAAMLFAVLLTSDGLAAHPGRTASDGCHSGGEAENERHCHGSKSTSTVNSEATWARQTVFVTHVVDGDTIKVRTKTEPHQKFKVRLRGLDCPEKRAGLDATRHVAKRLLSKNVVLQAGKPKFENDRFGRTLAYVEYMGVDIGKELIEQGMCKDFSHKFKHPRAKAYLRAQAEVSK